jgi:uncharacterized membrane-anchored protein YjiN (DUF445 family)
MKKIKNLRVKIRELLIKMIYRHIHKLIDKKISDSVFEQTYGGVHQKIFDDVSAKIYLQVKQNIKP